MMHSKNNHSLQDVIHASPRFISMVDAFFPQKTGTLHSYILSFVYKINDKDELNTKFPIFKFSTATAFS